MAKKLNHIDKAIYELMLENPEQEVCVMMSVNKACFQFHQYATSNRMNNLRLRSFRREVDNFITQLALPIIVGNYFANVGVFYLQGTLKDIITIGEKKEIAGVQLIDDSALH